ncbi:MAG: hypothetical protein K2O85_09270, partial [Helicobacter sp.]|nr:hypothetical protein [Helicobacter sp.]
MFRFWVSFVMLSMSKHLFRFLSFEILHSLTRVQNDKKQKVVSRHTKPKQSTVFGYPARLIATLITLARNTNN